ncbi:MAG TPA: MFS transporter, partial [Intrasporangium sp.]|nr:MFS transporter [Intrasporangium sp.]
DRWAGIASGVNNAVARAGSLLAVAAIPAVVGLSGADYQQPEAFDAGYVSAMWICAVMLAAGGVVSWLLIRNPEPTEVAAVQPAREVTVERQPAQRHTVTAGWSCAGSEGCPGMAIGYSRVIDADVSQRSQPGHQRPEEAE